MNGGDMHPDQVEAMLRASADDLGKPGNDDYYGHGRVNAFNAVSLMLAGNRSALGSGSSAGLDSDFTPTTPSSDTLGLGQSVAGVGTFGRGSSWVRVTDLPGDLLGLAFGSTTNPGVGPVGQFFAASKGDWARRIQPEQGEQYRVPGDEHEGVTDEAPTASLRLSSTSVTDLAFADYDFSKFADAPFTAVGAFSRRTN
jgi:hypothetical protein